MKGSLEFSLAIQNQVRAAVLHEIECFMEMQEMDFRDARGRVGMQEEGEII